MFSNRCPKCGSVANFYNLDFQGQRYYKCTRGLTSFINDQIGHRIQPSTHIMSCETIIDEAGKIFTGIIRWFDETGKPKSVRVVNGKEAGR